MGKPERKARKRICSSSSYFLRCFGIYKPNLDAGQETHKKKTTRRTRWFSRNGEITPAPIYESEKHIKSTVFEDDKQNLFRVIRHVTDRKYIATNGCKAVELESKEVFIFLTQLIFTRR